MLSLQLFGGVALLDEAGPIAGPSSQRRRLALLAVLAASPTTGVSRDKLVAYFWSDVFDIHMILRGDPQGGTNTRLLGDRDAGEFVELYHDGTGRLRMGMALSHDEPKLDPISDKLEELIRAGTNVKDISDATFGL